MCLWISPFYDDAETNITRTIPHLHDLTVIEMYLAVVEKKYSCNKKTEKEMSCPLCITLDENKIQMNLNNLKNITYIK